MYKSIIELIIEDLTDLADHIDDKLVEKNIRVVINDDITRIKNKIKTTSPSDILDAIIIIIQVYTNLLVMVNNIIYSDDITIKLINEVSGNLLDLFISDEDLDVVQKIKNDPVYVCDLLLSAIQKIITDNKPQIELELVTDF